MSGRSKRKVTNRVQSFGRLPINIGKEKAQKNNL